MDTPTNHEPEERTPRGTVVGLFFWTYLSPFIILIGLGGLLGGGGGLAYGLFVTAWIGYFPSGLIGLISDSKNVAGLAALGYLVYAAIFSLALWLREYYQTIMLWVLFFTLLVFNVIGCRSVADRVTSGMTLP